MSTSGRRPFSIRSVGRTINMATTGDALLAHRTQNDHNGHGHAGRALGPALTRLRDDPVLGCGDDTGEATRKKAAWRQVVLSRARRSRHDLLCAWAASPPRPDLERWGEEAAELILKARDSAVHTVSLWSWLEGCYQEQAWLSLHEAEAQIIEVLPVGELHARAEGLLGKARRSLGGDDPRIWCIKELLREDATGAALRPRLAHLVRATYDVLDDRYAQSRGYRNRLIRLTVMALSGIVLFLVAGMVGTPNIMVVDGKAGGWQTVVLLLLFGSIGALVTAIPPLAKANGARNPFSLPLFQLLLKLTMGPLFAVVGLLILEDRLIPHFHAPS
ncbi:MAG TPA: hypothetical protein VGK51_17605, partial [Actinomycetota bacterium]